MGQQEDAVIRSSPIKIFYFLSRVLFLKWLASLFNTPSITKNERDILEWGFLLQRKGYLKKLVERTRYSDEPSVYSFFEQNGTGNGADFFSRDDALIKTIAECGERFCWKTADLFIKKIGSTEDLRNEEFLDPRTLSGFSQAQRNTHKDKLFFDKTTNFSWIEARCLTRDSEAYIPAQLVSVPMFKKLVPEKEPMLRWTVSTGVAAGKSSEEAILHGLLELIERDAFMITYLQKLNCPNINLDNVQDAQINAFANEIRRHDLELKIVSLATDFPVYVFLAIIRDKFGKGPAITVGAKASFDPIEATLGAMNEAATLRLGYKKMYTRGFKGNLADMRQRERILYWCMEENAEKLVFLTRGTKQINLPDPSLAIMSSVEKLDAIIATFKKNKYDLYTVKLSNTEIERFGLHTYITIAPDLHPLHLDESIPYIWSERLYSVPLNLGYKIPKNLNAVPHPFS